MAISNVLIADVLMGEVLMGEVLIGDVRKRRALPRKKDGDGDAAIVRGPLHVAKRGVPPMPARARTGRQLLVCACTAALALLAGCSQEQQNRIGRGLQNWTGTNGVLDVYAGERLALRFIAIDKLTTATATSGDAARPYRFGYGIVDLNQNLIADPGEKRVYFEVSDYSTNYVFYENYR